MNYTILKKSLGYAAIAHEGPVTVPENWRQYALVTTPEEAGNLIIAWRAFYECFTTIVDVQPDK